LRDIGERVGITERAAIAREQNVGELLAILTGAPQSKPIGRSGRSR
jgi:hypothetical protein